MKFIIPMILCVLLLKMPVYASDFSAPTAPDAAKTLMPGETSSFSDALLELLQKTILLIRPDLRNAVQVSNKMLGILITVSILSGCGCKLQTIMEFTGTVCIASLLLNSTDNMLHLAQRTVQELSTYGRLLLPVMTGAMAAQGGITSATGLYLGTAVFDVLLGNLFSAVFVPGIYVYLALSVAGCACGEEILLKIAAGLKSILLWCLKTILTVFTTYMSITGVISGTTDAAAMKATKLAFSTLVPMVGGVLSDASESVLVGAALMKNAAGVYGVLVILALFLGPFVRIGTQYLVWKASCMISGVFATKRLTTLQDAFTAALGMLMAIIGAMCLLFLISTVCFMKGAGA